MVASHTYSFGEIRIYEHYAIAVMFEGVTIEPKHNEVLVTIANKYFHGKDFGYITHRINSYSVDPRIYVETSKIDNLAAFAIVSEKEINLSNAQIEKLFLKKPFKSFKQLAAAIHWVEKMVLVDQKNSSLT